MAMTINLTLVVQMIHFLIAAFFITQFLLKPGYDALKVDEDRLRQLRALISAQQMQVAQKEEHKNQRLTVFKNSVAQQRPTIEHESTALPVTVLKSAPSRTESELHNLTREVSEKLKKQVLNG
jgi:F0F1-type ATP synthase membrane subunit b/b'